MFIVGMPINLFDLRFLSDLDQINYSMFKFL